MDETRKRFEREALPHLRAVYNLALRLTQREADARDLSQDAFLRALQSFHTFVSGTNCKAWLLTVTYSTFVNRYRKERRDGKALAADAPRTLPVPIDAAPSMTPARAVAETDIETALAELPDDFRAVVVLVDVEEWSYEEAAAILDCPVGTIRSRLFRARKHLADRLREYKRDGRDV